MTPKEGKTCYKFKAPWTEFQRCKPIKINLFEEEDLEESSSEQLSDDELAENSENELHVISVDYEAEEVGPSIDLVSSQDNTMNAEVMEDPETPPQKFFPTKFTVMVN